ncbi:MAG: hypothetical protein AABY18_05285 [Candidatus Thermoplasmatota archaeon]
MRWSAPILLMLGLGTFVPGVSGHGALTINEFDTYAISDFEGQEDSFAWEGFEIWDVYVGDSYSPVFDSNGVYFKVNLAGDGTARPTQGETWTVTFRFNVGDQTFERQITHDGAAVTTDFEELEWQIADGNVFQVRAWAPVAAWAGQSLTDLVLVSLVDGEPRDTAPGGIHLPGTGTEVPVEAPATPVFPALGEGRLVESVPLTGPAKFLDVSVAPQDAGVFEFTIKNPLAEQGQHVMLQSAPANGWTVTAIGGGASLEGGASAKLRVEVRNDAPAGTRVEPIRLDLVTDIGGLQSYYAFLDGTGVAVVSDSSLAQAATVGDAGMKAPGASFLAMAAVLALAVASRLGRRDD